MILNGDFELRGIESKVSKNNNSYYVFHLEDSSGASNNAVARQPYDIVGLKKGDMLHCTFDCSFGKYPKCDLVNHEVLSNVNC